VLESASPFNNSRDMLFACRIPEGSFDFGAVDLRVILDGVQDPGNLGAVIRAADAFEIGEVILTGACADLYNPKTVRASAGAIFRQRTVRMSPPDIARMRQEGRVRAIYGAAADGAVGVRAAALSGCAVAIGSEGAGISPAVASLCDATLSIPMSPRADSLNAAVSASVIMWEAYASGATP
jgi:TrmH family RNA methyltransferase